MLHPELFHREAGVGPGVVCIHSNASTSGQWRGLIDLLAPRFHVLAPDSYGSGKSPEWPSAEVIGLRDEVALIEPVLTRAGSPLALVGHSYGAAVALIAALTHPGRIRAMALYEPTLFALLDAEVSPPNEADGIRNVVSRAGVELDNGDQGAAAEQFMDYWMGSGSWKQTPGEPQGSHRRLRCERAPLGACTVHGADATDGVPRARRSRSVHGGQEFNSLGQRRGSALDDDAAACGSARVR